MSLAHFIPVLRTLKLTCIFISFQRWSFYTTKVVVVVVVVVVDGGLGLLNPNLNGSLIGEIFWHNRLRS